MHVQKMVSNRITGVFFQKSSVDTKIGGRSSKMHENSPIFFVVPFKVYINPHVAHCIILSNLLLFGTPYCTVICFGGIEPFLKIQMNSFDLFVRLKDKLKGN